MYIYFELYFLLNYILDISILICLSRLLKYKISIKRLILSSFIGSSSLLLINIDSNILYLYKFIISSLMIISLFGFNKFFYNTFYFYIISIILGGSIYLFDNRYIGFIISFIIIIIFIIDNIKLKIVNSNKYKVEIYYNDLYYSGYGFIDTGNSLKDYFNRSIILIDKNISIDKPILVPFKALNSSGMIKCFKPDKLIVNNKIINGFIVGISNNKLNSFILPNDIGGYIYDT